MNKHELVEKVTSLSKACSKAEVNRVIDAFIKVVSDTLKKGGQVAIAGFGTFKTKKRAARTGVNPKTGEKINIPARVVPKFTPGKSLKDAVK
ncbi:HU family DNA-binding protein [bacterium]|nr:HU family DNA-binding protein [bacterium]